MAAQQFSLPALPWAEDALEAKGMSARTIGFHYGKHHAGYVKKLNAAVEGTDLAGLSLEELIKDSARKQDAKVFNNAAQTYNHSLFWASMSPDGGGAPKSDTAIAQKIEQDFGSYDAFAAEFRTAAATQFGSGWAWLSLDANKKLKISALSNAGCPLATDEVPLLTLDVWEHAYYLDVQNRRPDFIGNFLDNLVSWQNAENLLQAAGASKL